MVKLINMNDVKVEQIEWLLYPLIPYGKITILQGDPGEGKTTAMLQIIASLSKGEALPFNEVGGVVEPIKVIYQTAEDGLADTIKPRLLSAGANCSNVLVIDDTEEPLNISDERLEIAVEISGARLVVLDPLQGYLGAGVDMHRANEIRPLMHKLSIIAEKYKCAIVLIGHLNKNSMNKAGYRGLGSIDIPAAARSVIVCGRVKDDPELRILCQIKNSLAPEAEPIGFRLNKDTGFEWIGMVDVTIEELMSGRAYLNKTKEAENFLKTILKNGKLTATEIYKQAEIEGIKVKTLRNAKDALGVMVTKINNKWYWELK